MSDSFQPRGLQHTRLPCPSSTPEVCSGSCPLSQWCHSTTSSSVISFSSWPQSFPASGSFLMSQFFCIRWPKLWSMQSKWCLYFAPWKESYDKPRQCIKKQKHHFHCVDHNKLENSSRGRSTRPSYLPPEKSVCRSKSNMDMEQQTGSKSGKE